jgi:hypothetical protein
MLILINKDWFDLCCWHICISIFPAVQLIFKWDIILLVPIETNWQNKKKHTAFDFCPGWTLLIYDPESSFGVFIGA